MLLITSPPTCEAYVEHRSSFWAEETVSITTTIWRQSRWSSSAANFATKVVLILIATLFLTLTLVEVEARLDALPTDSGFASDIGGE